MSDLEQTGTPAVADSTPLESPNVDTTDYSVDDEPSLESSGSEPVEVDDGEEIDYDGEKYKVPAKLKDAFLRQADYTTKTQSLAQQRQEFEAAQQQFVQRQQFQQQHIQAVAKVMAIDERLEQFSRVDWNALSDADPVQAMKLDRQMRDLQQQRNAYVTNIEQTQSRMSLETQQVSARRLQEAASELVREIKGFDTPEIKKALKETGKAAGYRPEELEMITDPRAVKLLHKAYLYDKLVAAKSKPDAPEVKPITRVTAAKSTVNKDPSRMSDKEFASWRRSQISQRSNH